jgi:hypothetical protein
MALFRALVIVAGVTSQISDANTLMVGNGITTNSVAMSIDTAAAITIGGTSATSLTIGRAAQGATMRGTTTFGTGTTVTITDAGVSTFNGSATFTNSISQTGANTFSTGTGSVSLNGATTLISSFTQTGANTFSTGTGSVSLNGNTSVTGANTLTVGGVATFNGGATVASSALSGTGTASLDFSAASGVFKTTTGAVTIGPGAVTVSGATTYTGAGTALTVNNNATVTGTLTVGTLVATTELVASLATSGLTTAAMTGGAGQVGYLSGASTISPTDNAAAATSRAFGVFNGTAGQAIYVGTIAAALFTTAGGSPTNGAPVYLAAAADDGATGAGKLTATAPSAVGSVVAQVGLCMDNANYAGLKTAKILWQPMSIVQL